MKVIEDKWIELEDGIQIMFVSKVVDTQYNTCDWWWITARTATSDVEWPLDEEGKPLAQESIDYRHCYVPLEILKFNQNLEDQHRKFKRVWE